MSENPFTKAIFDTGFEAKSHVSSETLQAMPLETLQTYIESKRAGISELEKKNSSSPFDKQTLGGLRAELAQAEEVMASKPKKSSPAATA